MSKTYKHQATYNYLHGNKDVGKFLRGILRYFNRCNCPRRDYSRLSWYKHKLFKQGNEQDRKSKKHHHKDEDVRFNI